MVNLEHPEAIHLPHSGAADFKLGHYPDFHQFWPLLTPESGPNGSLARQHFFLGFRSPGIAALVFCRLA
jgi:hypothetical protein